MPEPSTSLSFLKQHCPTISVGVLTANWMNLQPQIWAIESAGVKFLHYDVMDGCFCPALTMGPSFVSAIHTTMFKDIHLMVDEPLNCIEKFVAAGADMVTVHAESSRHIHRTLQVLGQMENVNVSNHGLRGIIRGLALNPGTPAEVIVPHLDELDFILLLAVNPGWSGQKFIDATFDKLDKIKQLVSQSDRHLFIGIDGGVTKDNVAEIAGAGVDIIVTGSAVYDGKAPKENAEYMLKQISGISD